MITQLPNELLSEIQSEVKYIFNTDIDSEFITFIQRLQPEVAVEEGFVKQKTVRFFNLAVFLFNTKKRDSKQLMFRLLKKHNGSYADALVEFKQIGKVMAIQEQNDRRADWKEKRRKASIFIKPKATIHSVCGKYVIK